MDALKRIQKIIRENALEQKKKKPRLKYNPGLALIGLRTTWSRVQPFYIDFSKGLRFFSWFVFGKVSVETMFGKFLGIKQVFLNYRNISFYITHEFAENSESSPLFLGKKK